MNVFELRDRLIGDYGDFVRSFIQVRDQRIREKVTADLGEGLLWPDPLIQLNPAFEPGERIDDLVNQGVLHEQCRAIFRIKPDPPEPERPLRLHRHQVEAIRAAGSGASYVLTTGTGSGKSLAYIVPMVDHVLRVRAGGGIKGIVVYPMNALANSQMGELDKFLNRGFPDGRGTVRFARYTGQESDDERRAIMANPPDILLTNFVMLELILTRPYDRPIVQAAQGLRFLVLDELHTYRGRQGADVAMLVRRAREAFAAREVQFVGTSATVAGSGSFEEQRAQVAEVASRLFGVRVPPEHVIGETLRRSTPERDLSDAAFIDDLRERLNSAADPPVRYAEFVHDPLSVWIESTIGISTEPASRRLIRSQPRSVTGPDGVAVDLSNATGVDHARCVQAIQRQLLASYGNEKDPETGFPVFAFRLHQFVSRGDTIYASPEAEQDRYITAFGQQYVPGDRDRSLFPLAFCRACGQEYYVVRLLTAAGEDFRSSSPRDLSDLAREEDEGEPGFLYISSDNPWPTEPAQMISLLPEDWIEVHRGGLRVKSSRRRELPRFVRLGANGVESPAGTPSHFVPAPFRFCLRCGVSYDFRTRSDFGKLASLGTEGRSTATTIMSLAAIRYLRADATLSERARKLLSFTDNRQDASLQAGHFNDFIQVGLLRSALYRAVLSAGSEGLRHEDLTQAVFEALDLPVDLYAIDPAVRFQARVETDRALRLVLGYRLYQDLRRGWRITAPNLEQCGLLTIEYASLRELCEAPDIWEGCHPLLANASSNVRARVARVLLDVMRRELAVKVDVLDASHQERIQQLSSQRLCDPWSVDDAEEMEAATVLFPRSRRPNDYRGHYFLSARGGFGQYLRRSGTFETEDHIGLEETEVVVRDLLDALRVAGLVEVVVDAGVDDPPGYQLPASAMVWRAGDGSPYQDPIRTPRSPSEGGEPNPFFVEFYRTIAREGRGLEAREHTAQVPAEVRQERERRFREAELPILYCSPTMELGVDIAELNVVNLRNMPPTPANYAQRSGRAGRSGQPALVFGYCTTYSPHDQYFFRRPRRMVAGAVTPPRLDLDNEDLARAHVQAVWLAETGVSLASSVDNILDLSGANPSLHLLPSVRDDIRRSSPRTRTKELAKRLFESIRQDLASSSWYSDRWLDEVMAQVEREFDATCDRWRDLYRAASQQRALQHAIAIDNSRSPDDRKKARRLRAEAEAQIELLIGAQNAIASDFYSYRYFASEGFLPGYNFPRLPLSAFIPGRRRRGDRDEFLSRPRFLAISEFGPRAIVYHEGTRYRINRVILPVPPAAEGAADQLATTSVKQCSTCGYLHPVGADGGLDNCERCGTYLPAALGPLLRMQNVSTRRQDRINSDEEERQRLGYEIVSGVRFAQRGGRDSYRVAQITTGQSAVGSLTYGDAATIWRINLGWRRRQIRHQYGFVLDVERGFWGRNSEDVEDQDDPMSPRQERVIPYVEDRRNCLLFQPDQTLGLEAMASLQAALKRAIQVEFEIEDQELAVEPLPSFQTRRQILIYEAAEGGAGVLRRLVDDPDAIGRVATQALALCHFDPATGTDLRRTAGATEDCEAACYDCLMSYTNQPDHRRLDRKLLQPILTELRSAHVAVAPSPKSRAEHLAELKRLSTSTLERHWLDFLEERRLALPSHAQRRVEACNTRPDFMYSDKQTAVYVDGPHHQYPERAERDALQTERMEDAGFTVLRFGVDDAWEGIVRDYPGIFGLVRDLPRSQQTLEEDLFPGEWLPLLRHLATTDGVTIRAGADVQESGRVIGSYVAVVRTTYLVVHLVDGQSPSANAIRDALAAAGKEALLVDPTNPDARARVEEAVRRGRG